MPASKYDSEVHPFQAEKLCRLGATDAELADFFNISRSTLSLWKVEYQEFSDALTVGKKPADDRVKMSLYQRAVGYSHEEDDIKVCDKEIVVTKTVKHYPPDTTACIFWLKNRCKDEFRDKPEPGDDDYVPPTQVIVNVVDASADAKVDKSNA